MYPSIINPFSSSNGKFLSDKGIFDVVPEEKISIINLNTSVQVSSSQIEDPLGNHLYYLVNWTVPGVSQYVFDTTENYNETCPFLNLHEYFFNYQYNKLTLFLRNISISDYAGRYPIVFNYGPNEVHYGTEDDFFFELIHSGTTVYEFRDYISTLGGMNFAKLEIYKTKGKYDDSVTPPFTWISDTGTPLYVINAFI